MRLFQEQFGVSRPRLGITILTLSLVFGRLLPAATEPPKGMGLESLLKATLATNAQIKEVAADVEVARGQLARANAALFPKANALLLAAPIFEERGNATASTQNWGKWGPFLSAGVEIAQPLYTFGQIGSYQKAAQGQLSARLELVEAKRLEMVATLKEFYYGYQMACELDGLVGDLISFLEEAVKTADEAARGKKKSGVKPHDVYRLKTSLEDLRQKKLYAEQAKQTAERAVAWVSGQDQLSLGKLKLSAETFEKKTLDHYLKTARARRPELKALASGREALGALRDAKRAQSYPVVFLGALGSVGWSPVRDRQQSIYANDPFNRVQGGIGVGLKFDLEFARHSAEAAEQEAEGLKLKAKEEYAVPGIDLQVKKAFWELEQALAGLETAKRRKEISKKWFVSSAMGWSIGVTPAKDLMEALEGDGLSKKNYIETVYSYNLALARLTQAVGEEITSLRY